ncbi:MAG: DUF3108 domain-containing protein [Betaproteobacteria bacterium]|nr:MAG: DUF3108 domain-containing protein [Betaproteobacteria bacterium]
MPWCELKEMMRNWCWLLISLAGAAAAEPPARVELVFALTRNGSTMAEVVERLEYASGRYQLTETWKGKGIYALLGSARRMSQGSIVQGTLRPQEFFDERSGRDTARAWFDWKAQTLTMQYKGNKASEPLPANAQDRLSFLFALSLVPGKAESVSYTIADGRGLSRHVYKLAGRERIKTPAGEFDAIKASRHGEDRESAELWLAAERNYIPVRLLVVEKDGTRYEQVAIRISP